MLSEKVTFLCCCRLLLCFFFLDKADFPGLGKHGIWSVLVEEEELVTLGQGDEVLPDGSWIGFLIKFWESAVLFWIQYEYGMESALLLLEIDGVRHTPGFPGYGGGSCGGGTG